MQSFHFWHGENLALRPVGVLAGIYLYDWLLHSFSSDIYKTANTHSLFSEL
jgi:hypothetical protein